MNAWRSLTSVIVLVAVLAITLSPVVAAGPEYKIGVDDVLAISVWDQKDLDQVVTVRPDGKISLPLVGEVEAAGLTAGDLAARLTTAYSRTVRAAQVTVTVRDIRSRTVYFLGGVVKQGPLPLTQDLTVLQGLSLVGGPIPTADLESAFILRGPTRIPVNLLAIYQRGDLKQNVKLEPGDTIIVPNADAVYVQGEVKTPGQVKYAKGLTVVTAIAAAGGFTPLASTSRVRILRNDGTKKETISANVSDIMSDPESKDIPLKPNDVITVPQRLF
jgi:polysaccharide export outer membrane protein